MVASCDTVPATQVDVRFAAAPELTAEADELVTQVAGSDGAIVFEDVRSLGAGEAALDEVALVLVPEGDNGELSFAAFGALRSSSSGVVGESRVFAGYAQNERRYITAQIDLACRGVVCPDAQTCRHGRCVGAFFEPAEERSAITEPLCGECEVATSVGCSPRAPGESCGFGTCEGTACRPSRRIVGVALGRRHSCVQDSQRNVRCWGQNQLGQVGVDGAPEYVAEPSIVAVSGASSGAVGQGHSCWLDFNGSLFCWGDNGSFQFGTGVNDALTGVRPAATGERFAQIAAGNRHVCGIASSDGVSEPRGLLCWGANANGQCGVTPSPAQPTLPVRTPTLVLANVSEVDAFDQRTCAIVGVGSGELYCWGANHSQQTGSGSTEPIVRSPERVGCDSPDTCFDDWTAVSVGAYHTCGIRSGGQLYCWGGYMSGQLGVPGLDGNAPRPIRVEGEDWRVVDAGLRHTCGVRGAFGDLYCWGNNAHGELGVGDTVRRDAPTLLPRPGGVPWAAVHLGAEHTCAVRNDQTLFCWGNPLERALGDSAELPLPARVPMEVALR